MVENVVRIFRCRRGQSSHNQPAVLDAAAGYYLFPQSAVTQNFLNHHWLAFPNKADDLHRSTVLGVLQRVHLVYLLDQHSPTNPSLFDIGAGLFPFCACPIPLCCCLPLMTQSPLLVRIITKIAHQMLTVVWDVLRHLCQKFQRIKYLKIARQAGIEQHIPRFWKPHTLAFAGSVNNLTS